MRCQKCSFDKHNVCCFIIIVIISISINKEIIVINTWNKNMSCQYFIVVYFIYFSEYNNIHIIFIIDWLCMKWNFILNEPKETFFICELKTSQTLTPTIPTMQRDAHPAFNTHGSNCSSSSSSSSSPSSSYSSSSCSSSYSSWELGGGFTDFTRGNQSTSSFSQSEWTVCFNDCYWDHWDVWDYRDSRDYWSVKELHSFSRRELIGWQLSSDSWVKAAVDVCRVQHFLNTPSRYLSLDNFIFTYSDNITNTITTNNNIYNNNNTNTTNNRYNNNI